VSEPAATRYSGTAQALHWLMAVLLGGLLALGLYMADLALSPDKLRLYSWHKWAGVTAFALLLVRLAWRVAHRPPPLPQAMPKPMQLAAHGGHLLLYALMFAIPLSGWLMSSAKGFQTVWFGVLPIPDLIGKDRALGEQLTDIHESLNWLLMAVLAVHVGAALKHHFIDHDDVLRRMWPGRSTATEKHP
jgi:cytochrome b561